MLYVRKQPQGFGRNAQIEGELRDEARVLLVEDLASEGTSKLNFVVRSARPAARSTDSFVIFNYGIFPQSRDEPCGRGRSAPVARHLVGRRRTRRQARPLRAGPVRRSRKLPERPRSLVRRTRPSPALSKADIGIPVGPGLLNRVRQIAQAAAASWLSVCHSGAERSEEPGTHEHGRSDLRHPRPMCVAGKAGVHGFRARGVAAPRNDRQSCFRPPAFNPFKFPVVFRKFPVLREFRRPATGVEKSAPTGLALLRQPVRQQACGFGDVLGRAGEETALTQSPPWIGSKSRPGVVATPISSSMRRQKVSLSRVRPRHRHRDRMRRRPGRSGSSPAFGIVAISRSRLAR